MNIKISSLIKSLIVSYVITLLILVLLSFLLLKFQLSESIISIGITLSYVISCFTGGYIAGKMSSSRRFLYGLLLGGVYFIFLTLISLVLNKGIQSDATHFITVMLMCSLSGMLGGMLTNGR
ncbi:MAG: TIGR04086 family membrane protein [Lachnospiraceae bacterium]|nr:TIGR04086 family membrane protein [Lachnospiraceae bacterium]